jgi:outer membrane immunogenic protein
MKQTIFRGTTASILSGVLMAVASAIAGYAIAVPAHAAELPVKAPRAMPPPVVDYWSGMYVGVEAGWKQVKTDWTTTCLTADGTGATCGTALNPFFVDGTSPQTFTSSGVRIGGYAGANLLVSPNWLIGIEGDLAWFDRRTTVVGIVGCSNFCGFTHTVNPLDSTSVRLTTDTSIRLRAGFLVTPDVLFYGTGGLAGQWLSETVTCGFGQWCVANRVQTNDQPLLIGWTAGGGIEWRVAPQIFIRGEYRFSEFQSTTTYFFPNTVDLIIASVRPKTQMANFGIAYHF